MKPRVVVLAALGWLVATTALANGPESATQPRACAEDVAARVQAHYDGVRDLRAGFTQRSRSVALGGGSATETPARGRVLFAKPGRMRWEYESPEPSLVVSDGETLWIYDPKAREVQVLSVGAGLLSAAAIQFLLGEGQLLESFSVEASGCGEPEVELTLTPRQAASYERLELRVSAATGAVRESEVVDLFGNRTRVSFEAVETNTSPADAQFRFEPPEGVRVLELLSQP